MQMSELKRSQRFQRNPKLEELLTELRTILEPAERAYLGECIEPEYPVLFVVGAPRSGTTVTVQWLAGSGLVAYASNLLSRFFASPYIGARIQQLLTDPAYSYGNELAIADASDGSFRSTLGKTEGLLEPNEFWYFWRRFIPNEQPEQISADDEARIDVAGFRRGMGAIQKAFEKPFATKGVILQYNLRKLREIFPRCLFVFMQRNGVYNTQSLLEARLKYYGDTSVWYSARPPGYERLLEEDPYTQVAGQVHLTNQSIRRELADLPAANTLPVMYEQFCENPEGLYVPIVEKLADLGYPTDHPYHGPERFEATNQRRLPPEEFARVEAAWAAVAG